MKHSYRSASLRRRLMAWALLALAAVLAPAAWAAPSCSAPSVALTLPNATVPLGATVGTTFGTATNGSVTFTCSGLPTGFTRFTPQMYGLTAGQLYPATLPTGKGITTITYATNVSGVGVQLTMNPGMASYDVLPGDQQSGAYVLGYVNGNGTLTVSYTAQLIVTGTVAAGTINAITMGKYEWYIYGYNVSQTLGTNLTLTAGTTVSIASCSVATASQNLTVTLPTLSTKALTGQGATAGQTPFNINLNCQASVNVSVTMASAAASSSVNGLINPTTGSGYASNIGVQLLDQNSNPIPWNKAVSYGKVATGTVSLPFFARYYQTAATNSAGKVTGTATFTMTYQ